MKFMSPVYSLALAFLALAAVYAGSTSAQEIKAGGLVLGHAWARATPMGLKAPLKQGDRVPMTLQFEKAGKVDVTFDVQSIGATQPSGMSMPSSDAGKMHKM